MIQIQQIPTDVVVEQFHPDRLTFVDVPAGPDGEAYFMDRWGVSFKLQFFPPPAQWRDCEETPEAYLYGLAVQNTPEGFGLEYRILHNHLFLRTFLTGWRDLPTENKARAAAVMELMRRQMAPKDPKFRNGSMPELVTVMQDFSSWLGVEISVTSAKSDKKSEAPEIHVPTSMKRISQRFLQEILDWFWPVADAADLSGRWLHHREAFCILKVAPQELTGHERIETAARLSDFIKARAGALELSELQLKNALSTFKLP